ncbi:MAG: periplasmic heavy metal sensor [Alphaproteobacteria bacterium]|nr:periplasmic heavy metal sensor [Alphaproteobacteria bacterium]
MSEQTTTKRRGFGYAAVIAAGLLGLVGGGLVSTAVGHNMVGAGFRHFGGHHDRGPVDPAEAKEHAARMAGHLAWAVDATDAQKQQLTQIAQAMVNDLLPAHEKMRSARGKIANLLRAPKTDRAALEAMRAEHVALADDVSKRIAQGMADAADVLTPQQRSKLAAHWSF